MPEWLVEYLAFSVAGGITTYITVLREADKIYRESTEEKSKLGITGFVMWSLVSIFIAPILAMVILRGKTEELVEGIAIKWVEDARHND
jgi:hypothetical protein